MTKSASTLAYRLVWLTLQNAGFTQPRVPPPVVDAMHSVNFVQELDSADIETLWEIAKSQGYPLVVKTHAAPSAAVIAAFASGRAIGSASFRDPRDMALSMLDHGAKARRKDHWAFSEYRTVDDTLDRIREQCKSLEKWLELSVLPLKYDDIAFNGHATVQKFMDQLGIDGDPADILRQVEDRKYIQFNKGVQDRFKTEMLVSDSNRLSKEFAPLIARLQA